MCITDRGIRKRHTPLKRLLILNEEEEEEARWGQLGSEATWPKEQYEISNVVRNDMAALMQKLIDCESTHGHCAIISA